MSCQTVSRPDFINVNYSKLPGNYLFSEIAKRVAGFTSETVYPEIIRLGIGDVTKPLCSAVVTAMHAAVDEMAHDETFRGYGPEQGYPFLREAIAAGDYASRGVKISIDEIFVSDGAKCDCANISELFSENAVVAVCDPVYPVYVDSNAMAGRAGNYDPVTYRWDRLVYMPCTQASEIGRAHV